jgi:peptidoglycan biosynthesis protein MviN/MurJ (putative lipid II flippase)
LLVVALSLMLELFLPSSGRILAIGAAVCALATWAVPAIGLVRARRQARPVRGPPSLARVGLAISVYFLCACLSAIAAWLALLSLAFARGAPWACLALLAIAAFWGLGAILFAVVGTRSRLARKRAA